MFFDLRDSTKGGFLPRKKRGEGTDPPLPARLVVVVGTVDGMSECPLIIPHVPAQQGNTMVNEGKHCCTLSY